ncbi:MAG: glycosyltransferase, partial [Ignavibacteria bacterium]|nr:glycosyltransferase [Ignavibacteria bacterium]
MNIVIVGTAFPLRGGIAHFNALLSEALSARHAVRTITFKRQYPSFLFPGKTQEDSGEEPKAGPAPQLVDSINPLNWIDVGKMIRQEAPDLVIFKFWIPFFGPCFGTIARIAKRRTETKVLFICDNVIPHEHRPGDRVFTRFAFRGADYFIVQSNAVERDLKSFWPGAVYRNVPHPVYDIFGPSIGKHHARARLQIRRSNVILFFGYIRAYKGLTMLLEAMAKLGDEHDVLLMVVGEFYE